MLKNIINGINELAEYLGLKDNNKAMNFAVKYLEVEKSKTKSHLYNLAYNRINVDRVLEELYRDKYASISFDEAALYLGIDEKSLKEIIKYKNNPIVYDRKDNRFLMMYLNEFIDRTIEKYNHKISKKYPVLFSSVTSQRLYFIKACKEITGLHVNVQKCQINKCEHVASQYCSNKIDCSPNGRRKICLAHGYMIETKKSPEYHPDVICLECAKRNIKGELQFNFIESVNSVEKRIKE